MNASAMNTLALLLDQIAHERDRALGAEQHARQTLDQARQQLAQLRAYGDDYAQRWGLRPKHTASIESMRHYHNFMAQLERAAVLQQRRIEQTEEAWQAARQTLARLQTRVASIEALMARRQNEAAQVERKLEQKLNDELAARIATRVPMHSTRFGAPTDFAPA